MEERGTTGASTAWRRQDQDCIVEDLRFRQVVPGGDEEAVLKITWREQVGDDVGTIECFQRYENAAFLFVLELRDGRIRVLSFPERYQFHETSRTCEPRKRASRWDTFTEAGELVVRLTDGVVERGRTTSGLDAIDACAACERLVSGRSRPRIGSD